MNTLTLPAKTSYRTLWLVVGLLLLPFAIASGLYLSGWQPTRSTEHGRLLDPPQTLPPEVLRSTAANNGKWLLLLTVPGPCAADCNRRLDEMRRIQVALNKDMRRLARVVLSDQPNDPALLATQRIQPDLLRVAGTPTDGGTQLYIADPQGRLIIAYPPEAEARGIRADLERLLKFAWNG